MGLKTKKAGGGGGGGEKVSSSEQEKISGSEFVRRGCEEVPRECFHIDAIAEPSILFQGKHIFYLTFATHVERERRQRPPAVLLPCPPHVEAPHHDGPWGAGGGGGGGGGRQGGGGRRGQEEEEGPQQRHPAAERAGGRKPGGDDRILTCL